MVPASLILAALLAGAPDAPPAEAPAPAKVEDRIRLGVGTQKVLQFPGLERIAVAAPEVLDVKPLADGQLLLIGLARGRSDLTLFRRDGTRGTYHVDVTQNAGCDYDVSELRQLLRDSPDAQITMIGERIYVEGTLGSVHDFELLKTLFPSITVFARLDPAVAVAKVKEANDTLVRLGLGSARLTLVGRKLFIEGQVSDADELRKVQAIADAVLLEFGDAL